MHELLRASKRENQLFGEGTNTVSHNYTKGDGLAIDIVGTFVLVYTIFSSTNAKRSTRDSHVPEFLDEQFTQLQQLQDESNPDFVGEVVSLFFEDAQKLLGDLSKTLNWEPVDFKKVDACVHQFKGSSSSIGARRVKNVCLSFRASCQDNDREGCLQCLQQMKQECYIVKTKLETLFQLEKQILAAGGTIPTTE